MTWSVDTCKLRLKGLRHAVVIEGRCEYTSRLWLYWRSCPHECKEQSILVQAQTWQEALGKAHVKHTQSVPFTAQVGGDHDVGRRNIHVSHACAVVQLAQCLRHRKQLTKVKRMLATECCFYLHQPCCCGYHPGLCINCLFHAIK